MDEDKINFKILTIITLFAAIFVIAAGCSIIYSVDISGNCKKYNCTHQIVSGFCRVGIPELDIYCTYNKCPEETFCYYQAGDMCPIAYCPKTDTQRNYLYATIVISCFLFFIAGRKLFKLPYLSDNRNAAQEMTTFTN